MEVGRGGQMLELFLKGYLQSLMTQVSSSYLS